MFILFDWVRRSLEKALVGTPWQCYKKEYSRNRLEFQHSENLSRMVFILNITDQEIDVLGNYSDLKNTFLVTRRTRIPYSAKSFDKKDFLVPFLTKFIEDLLL